MRLYGICIASLVVNHVFSFSCQSLYHQPRSDPVANVGIHMVEPSHITSRAEFLQQVAIANAVTVAWLSNPTPASARGRATLEFAYEKYTPRILAGGVFYKEKMKSLIANNDFSGIKSALAEPPKKRKEDLTKIDGGISERAAQAGSFSDSRVIVAMDLFASQFSDSSISPKTKAMKKEVDELRSIVHNMDSLAKQALGEESSGGSFFGFGMKAPSASKISQQMKELYIAGGTAWNRYVFAANDGLPVTFSKLPYL